MAPTVFDVPESIDLDWLTETAAELPRDVDDDLRKQLLGLMGEVGRPDRIRALLRGVMADRELLGEIGARSYRHVNHFDKIVLVDGGDASSYRVTLHLWRPPYAEKEIHDELIHDHRFSFWSTVLCGTLDSQNFVRSPEGQIFNGYRYIPEKAAVSTTSNFYEFTGEGPLLTSEPSKEECGATYYLSYDSIHRVVLPEVSQTCTLVLRGPREREFSNVYNTSYPSHDVRAVNEFFTADEVYGKLGHIVAELDHGV